MSNSSDFFSESGAQSGINKMRNASERQSENASGFQKKLLEMQNGVFKGAISEKFYSQANQHAENLKTEANNTNGLASNSEKIKNFFAELAERMKSRLGL